MSADDVPILAELALVFGILGLALRELRALRRAQREDQARDSGHRDEPRR